MEDKKMVCKCGHHSVVPLMITLIGLSFLLARLNILTEDFANLVWPILLLIAGLTKLGNSQGMCKCC